MRKLASIQKIASFTPIEGKDRIVLAHFVDWGWQAIVRKDDFKVGDLCVYIEPDSLLPADDPNFAFMADKHFKVKTMKMGGVRSEGLVMPVSILPDGMTPHKNMDVTELLKITEFGIDDDKTVVVNQHNTKKYPRFLMKHKWFRDIVLKDSSKRIRAGFPTEFSKTDETRIQENPKLAKMFSPCVATEKVDGTSSTYMLRVQRAKHFWQKDKYEFIVCSHNRQLFDKKDMPWIWRNAEKYEIEDRLKESLEHYFTKSNWIAIQGETIAPKIQNNNYRLAAGTTDLYVFNLITEETGRVPTLAAKFHITKRMDMKFVPIIDSMVEFDSNTTSEDILTMATGKSLINPDRPREGIVFRSVNDAKKSFKAVSPSYLLGENDAAV